MTRRSPAQLTGASAEPGWRYDPRSGMLTIEVSLSQGTVITTGKAD